MSSTLLPDDLHQHSLPPPPVEIPVEDLLPGAEVQPPLGDGNHHFSPHALPLDVRVRIVFTPVILPVLAGAVPASNTKARRAWRRVRRDVWAAMGQMSLSARGYPHVRPREDNVAARMGLTPAPLSGAFP